MDTELLKTFLEVSRTRHFGRAAEALYLTQSAVSFRIRQLENQLGVNLFTRHRNNIRLTTAGEKLLPYAETLMNTWQAARKEVAHTSRHNEFSIGASASLWECMLNAWLGRLYQLQEPAKRPAVRSQNRSTAIACEATSMNASLISSLLPKRPKWMSSAVSC
ncbi:transcriptional regulator HdfR [Salmonella enterica subsp. enterica]|uniref:Transcriptional regulator HdfR n=1 Tax=Salmonella enterica I TaxID=59201 RepID=A0A447N160_SALET|nr:transcriptional regulator HdfR [Salmonella enterica subsp. enterica]